MTGDDLLGSSPMAAPLSVSAFLQGSTWPYHGASLWPGRASKKRSWLERTAKDITPIAEKTLAQSWTGRIYLHKAFPFSLALSHSANLQNSQRGVLKQHLKESLPYKSPCLSPWSENIQPQGAKWGLWWPQLPGPALPAGSGAGGSPRLHQRPCQLLRTVLPSWVKDIGKGLGAVLVLAYFSCTKGLDLEVLLWCKLFSKLSLLRRDT